MSNIIVNTKTADALILLETSSATVKYAEYIEANAVTAENVGKHVSALVKRAMPDYDGKTATPEVKAGRKYLMNRFRNGLNYQLGASKVSKSNEALLTGKGKHATLEEVIAAWHAAQE